MDKRNDSTDQVSTGSDRDEPPTTLIDTGSLVAKEKDAAVIVNEQDEYEIDDDEDEDTVGNPDGCCPRCCSLICPSCCKYLSHRSVLFIVFYINCICTNCTVSITELRYFMLCVYIIIMQKQMATIIWYNIWDMHSTHWSYCNICSFRIFLGKVRSTCRDSYK